jgi:hypothetical protein
VTHEQIAQLCGVSVQGIRQARIDQDNPSYRSPPAKWPGIIALLAYERRRELKKLIEAIEAAYPPAQVRAKEQRSEPKGKA